MLFLTIPTAGKRSDLLQNIIKQSGLPPERILIVATVANAPMPTDCTIIEDFGSVNIQRWWLRGIEEAVNRGATAVAVSNDDVIIDSETLPRLHESLKSSGATIASPAREDRKRGLYRGGLIPYSPVIWGSLWMLDPSRGLRPDTQYNWWYGDNDLDIRARRDYTGVISVSAHFEHKHSGEATGISTQLRTLAEADLARFQSEYSRIVWTTHKIHQTKRIMRRLFPTNSLRHSHEKSNNK